GHRRDPALDRVARMAAHSSGGGVSGGGSSVLGSASASGSGRGSGGLFTVGGGSWIAGCTGSLGAGSLIVGRSPGSSSQALTPGPTSSAPVTAKRRTREPLLPSRPIEHL